MSIKAVNIVLSLVNARISGIEREGVVVEALIVVEIWHKRQVPSAVLLLTETFVPRVIFALGFFLLETSGTSAALLLNIFNRLGFIVSRVHFTSFKAPRFIHIDPYSIESELIVEVLETAEPHVGGLLVEPVNKDSDLGPYLVNQVVVVLLALVLA
jgi:hypothetical protein